MPLTADQFTRPIESSFRSIHDTIVHIYGAELLWFMRWDGQAPTALPGGQYPDAAAIRKAWLEVEKKIRALIDRLGEPGMSRVFEYRLLNGQQTSTPFWQMLQHVVNHGSYHRGQVTTMLRQLGAQPPKSMDLITYYRTTAGQRLS